MEKKITDVNDVTDSKTVITDSEWIKVIRTSFPEVGADDYIYTEALRETVAAIIVDENSLNYVMRMEGTLSSNFHPTLKIMTETIEPEDTDHEFSVIRGVKEEFGIDVEEDRIAYLGTINGTFQELHNYHIYFIFLDYEKTDFEGDGSVGEERSSSQLIEGKEWNMVKDFLSWISYGMLQNAWKNPSHDASQIMKSKNIEPEIIG